MEWLVERRVAIKRRLESFVLHPSLGGAGAGGTDQPLGTGGLVGLARAWPSRAQLCALGIVALRGMAVHRHFLERLFLASLTGRRPTLLDPLCLKGIARA